MMTVALNRALTGEMLNLIQSPSVGLPRDAGHGAERERTTHVAPRKSA